MIINQPCWNYCKELFNSMRVIDRMIKEPDEVFSDSLMDYKNRNLTIKNYRGKLFLKERRLPKQ